MPVSLPTAEITADHVRIEMTMTSLLIHSEKTVGYSDIFEKLAPVKVDELSNSSLIVPFERNNKNPAQSPDHKYRIAMKIADIKAFFFIFNTVFERRSF